MNKKNLLTLIVLSVFKLHAQISTVQTFSTTDRDNPNSLCTDSDGNVYAVVGSAKKTSLIKFDPNGKILWEKEDANWVPHDIKTNGNFLYVTGSFTTGWDTGTAGITAKGMSDIFIAKYRLSGEREWIKTAGGTGSEYGRYIDIDKAGNSYISGIFTGTISIGSTTMTHLGEGDIFLAAYDSSGKVVWAKRIACSLIDELYGMQWIEKKKMLLLNAYIQISSNLGNGQITKENSLSTIAYNNNGIAQKIISGNDQMELFAIDSIRECIYFHSGTNDYDSSGFLYVYNFDLTSLLIKPIRKGTKSMVLSHDRAYIFGSSPLIINSIVQGLGYLDIYDSSWTSIASNTFGTHTNIQHGVSSKGIFWGLGTYTDTSQIYGHTLIAQPNDQDVFLLRINELTLRTESIWIKTAHLYPNPATQLLMVSDLPQNTMAITSIYDLKGRLCNCPYTTINNTIEFDISGLEKGLYMIQIQTPDHIYYNKFLKQ